MKCGWHVGFQHGLIRLPHSEEHTNRPPTRTRLFATLLRAGYIFEDFVFFNFCLSILRRRFCKYRSIFRLRSRDGTPSMKNSLDTWGMTMGVTGNSGDGYVKSCPHQFFFSSSGLGKRDKTSCIDDTSVDGNGNASSAGGNASSDTCRGSTSGGNRTLSIKSISIGVLKRLFWEEVEHWRESDGSTPSKEKSPDSTMVLQWGSLTTVFWEEVEHCRDSGWIVLSKDGSPGSTRVLKSHSPTTFIPFCMFLSSAFKTALSLATGMEGSGKLRRSSSNSSSHSIFPDALHWSSSPKKSKRQWSSKLSSTAGVLFLTFLLQPNSPGCCMLIIWVHLSFARGPRRLGHRCYWHCDPCQVGRRLCEGIAFGWWRL